MKLLILAIVATLAMATACGDDDTTPTPTLANARDVEAARALDLGTKAPVGGLQVTVSSATYPTDVQGKPSDPTASWLLATVRVENPTSADATYLVRATCNDGSQAALYANTRPDALITQKPVPAKSVAEGTVLVAIPASCKANGALTVAPQGEYTGKQPQPASWKLP